MKKNLLLLTALLFLPLSMSAQQTNDLSAGEETLFEKVTKIEKKQDYFPLLAQHEQQF